MENLRYTVLPSVTRIPREELWSGRRLGDGGHLHGALHTLGYYSTDVCLGSPGRKFDLIIDTGSSVTAVPCSTCRQCGMHRCGRTKSCYDSSLSPTFDRVDCQHAPPGFTCEHCSPLHGSKCSYSVHYTEGSAIQGHVVADYAHFTKSSYDRDGTSQPVRARVYFGCQTLETGMFYRQEADGIMGMQPPRARARVPSFLTSLVQQQERATEAFSLCLSERSGLFLLGGQPDAAMLKKRGALSLPMDRNARARYTLNLREVRVSGSGRSNGTFRGLGLPSTTYSPTLVDSGTTFVYASTPLYRALHAHLNREQPSLKREGGKMCAFLTNAQVCK